MFIPRLLLSSLRPHPRLLSLPFPSSSTRSLSYTAIHLGAHGSPQPFVGPGGQPGSIPTDLEQSTGLERFEHLSELQGRDAFDMKPLHLSHLGTSSKPIVIQSVDPVRYVGCSGYPVDSHDTIWLRVTKETGVDRCPECGCCYQLKRVDPPSAAALID